MKPEIAQPQLDDRAAHFSRQLSSTRRGARLARLLVMQQFAEWGWPPDSDTSQAAALVVAELAANAITHGRVAGRDFLLGLTLTPDPVAPTTLRIEVSDCRGERPPLPRVTTHLAEHGRGLLLVDALAARWGTFVRPPSGKTVWAEL